MEEMNKSNEKLGYQIFRKVWTERLGEEAVEKILMECDKNCNCPELFRNDREIFAESSDVSDDDVVLSDDE